MGLECLEHVERRGSCYCGVQRDLEGCGEALLDLRQEGLQRFSVSWRIHVWCLEHWLLDP